MAKRIADKELTDRNWDQEEEGEEAGTFSVASEDVLKSRPIKKAKRRGGAAAETESSATFKGFKGFSLTPSSGPGRSGGPAALTNGAGLVFASSAPDLQPKQTNGARPPSSAPCGSAEYDRQLTALNCSVRDWIAKHVNDNPLCDLNPIFRDYERHLATIERRYGAPGGGACADRTPAPAPPSLEARPPPGVSFNFGQKVDGSLLAPAGVSSGVSLLGGAAAPSRSQEAPPTADENEEEEEEQPPRPEVKEVQERDAFYSKKCKLFYKKEAEFKEKGVGTLHLKRTEQRQTQLIIRADTNLGNILLNILLHASTPCTRVGRNNVMLMCVPNPPVDQKNPGAAVPLLVRVKTAEDADELHKILEEEKS